MSAPPIAAKQAGAFTRAQAHATGTTWSTIQRRVADGRWSVVVSGVLRVTGEQETDLMRAWAGHLATRGIVCGPTAGALYGICAASDEIHVISPVRVHVRASGVVDHRVRLHPDDVTTRGGLPLTTRLRTVVDLLASSPERDAAALLFRAVQQGWITREQLDEQIRRRRNMTGTKQLRSLSTRLGTGAHSVAEYELHQILGTLPGLVQRANVPLTIAGEDVVVDVLLPAHRIVIEVDGRRFHSDADTFARDRRRQNLLVAAGYIVLRFTWFDLADRPDEVRRSVTRAIAVSNYSKTSSTGP